jgi:transcriptional regulator with XRE-family HTH domain
MSNGKIDRVKLSQLLRSGKTQRECAQVFGVTEGAISQAKKELNLSVVKSVSLERAHEVIDKNLNAIEQLQDINRKARDLLDKAIAARDHGVTLNAMREIRGQLSLQLEIFKTLYDLEAVAEFQREVLTIIGEVDHDVREKIIQRLKERSALRGSITIN